MANGTILVETRVKDCKNKLDEFYRTRFTTVLDILINFTNLKLTYSGKDTAMKLQEMISLQKYYQVRLNKLKALQEELNLYFAVLEDNGGTLDILHSKLAQRNIQKIEIELDELIKEVDEIIKEYEMYTKNASKGK